MQYRFPKLIAAGLVAPVAAFCLFAQLSLAQLPAPTPSLTAPKSVGEFEGDDSSTGDTVSPPESANSEAVGKPETRVIPPLFFGMQMHSLLSDPKDHARAAESAARLGAKFVRDECFWHVVEKQKGVYKIPDVPLENLKTNKAMGLETLIILDYTNDLYDEGHAPTSPEAVEAFGRYCFHMAEELKDQCRYFEIWNEPNTDGFWRPRRDAKAYARIMDTAIREIHRANPEAVAFAGALSGIDGDFMSVVCDTGDCAQMDVLSLHPYCTPRSPAQAGIFDLMNNLRLKIFPSSQSRRPLWVTEVGYPTNLQGGVGEWRQAEMIAQTYLLGATRPELQGIVWYWMGPDGPDALWAEDRFGVIRPGYKGRKPAAFPYDVLAHLLPGFSASTAIQEIPKIPDSRVIRFLDDKGRSLTAVYVEEGEYSIDVMDQKSVEVVPLTGAATDTLEDSSIGQIQVNISAMPILIRSAEPLKIRKSKQAQFLYTRSGDVPRGGTALFEAASRQPLRKTDIRAVTLWPGRLVAEQVPSPLPWTDQSFPEGEAAELAITVGANEPAQQAPLAAYWFAPTAKHPSARLARTLTVTDPVTLDIRGVIGARGKPTAAVSIANTTDRALPVELQLRVEGRDDKTFSIRSLPPGVERSFAAPIESLPSPDAVVEVDATAKLPGDVEVNNRNYLSFLLSPKADTPPTIDGDLSDWTRPFPTIELGKRNQIVAERDTWGGPADASARVWTEWDNDWFYVAAELRDDIHVEEATGFTVYNNDGLEVYIDSDRENGRKQGTYGPHQFQYGLFPSQGEDVLYDFHHVRGPSPGGRIKITRNPAAAQRHPGEPDSLAPNMILEAAIPMKELQLEPRSGLEIGFTVALNDDDTPGYVDPFKQDLQMQWSRQGGAWQRPATFASLRLIDFPNPGPSPTPVSTPATAPDGTTP